MPQRKVSVINHYAFPPGSGGITRNFDMFSRLRGWQPHFYAANINHTSGCLLYTSPSPRDGLLSRMPSSA